MGSIEDLRIDSPPPARAKRPRIWRVVVVLVLTSTVVGWWVLRVRDGATAAKPVEVVAVSSSNSVAATGFSAGGYLEIVPPGPRTVSTLIEGRVGSLAVIEGQTVEAGQELARLDDMAYRQEVEVREAAVSIARARIARLEAGYRHEEIEQARANRNRAAARLVQARREDEMNQKLAETGAIAQRGADASRADLAAAEAELAVREAELSIREQGYRQEDIVIARSDLAAAQAELDRARWRLDRCVILAPVAGVVMERVVHIGDWVSPRGDQRRAATLMTIADPRHLQAWVDVNQRDMGKVSVGQEAVLITDAQPDSPIAGRVSRVLPMANLQKNTVRVNIEIVDPSPDAKPDMSVKVTFMPTQDREEASTPAGMFVPTSAVVGEGSEAGVYVVAGGRATFRRVVLGARAGNRVAVASGLSPEERVVKDATDVRDGDRVQANREGHDD